LTRALHGILLFGFRLLRLDLLVLAGSEELRQPVQNEEDQRDQRLPVKGGGELERFRCGVH